MLFQTTEFLWLMLGVLAGVVLLRTRTLQLTLILVASWIFYASWEPRFLALLLFCTVNDYALGLAIGGASSARTRKLWLLVSLTTNLGVLAQDGSVERRADVGVLERCGRNRGPRAIRLELRLQHVDLGLRVLDLGLRDDALLFQLGRPHVVAIRLDQLRLGEPSRRSGAPAERLAA